MWYNLLQWWHDLFRRNLLGGVSRSSRWSTVRKEFLRKNPTCAVCGVKKHLEVHHIIPYHLDKDLELLESNFIALCRRDHLLFGHLGSFRSFNPMVKINSADMYYKIQNRP